MKHIIVLIVVGASFWAVPQRGFSEEEAADSTDVAAGHSRHGEAFNEGPRQQAYLLNGTGEITFEVTSEVDGVQKFVEQGIGQLHGFWYFEAERSFRQAAMLDPACAIAYWGMAQANTNNKDRAKELIEEAVDRMESASAREQLYIKSLHEFLTGDGKKKEREAEYVSAVEAIVEAYPDDIEAKALLGYALYRFRGSADRTHAEVDVVLDQILAKQKNHPVHHYRIHLWDHKSPQRALDSAALCGPSSPGIAHMWHMCGHIFSRVKRYGDAAWFQEASARVDHRHMMHNHMLPDQIHNFAHNNEWFIRNMMNVGRVREALDLAKNMIELPRHPTYNTLDERHSASYGRDRLMDVLERFELWDEVIAFSDTRYLEPTDDVEKQLRRLRMLGQAFVATDQPARAHEVVAEVEQILESLKADPPRKEDVTIEEDEDDEDGEEEELSEEEKEERLKKAFEKKKDEHDRKVERAEQDVALIMGHLAVRRGEYREALLLLDKADANDLTKARVQLLAGENDEAVKAARQFAKDRKNQVYALAGLVDVLWRADQPQEAYRALVELRANSHWIEGESPVFERIDGIAEELGFGKKWQVEMPPAEDLGEQPELATLGPFRWQPTPAPDWLLADSSGKLHSLRGYRGRPVVIVFYLGYGCLHCAEQLQALAPRAEDFRRAGIDMIAISTDNIRDLDNSQKNYDGKRMPFPLVSNASQDIFRAYRCYDDFEQTPLHGTYLIDAEGRIRWQDISYDPFMDVEFLLSESQRLLTGDKPAAKSSDRELARRTP